MLGHSVLIIWLSIEVVITLAGFVFLFQSLNEFIGNLIGIDGGSFISNVTRILMSVFILGGIVVAFYTVDPTFVIASLPFFQILLMLKTLLVLSTKLRLSYEKKLMNSTIIFIFSVIATVLVIFGWFVRMILPPADLEYVVRLLFGG